MRAVIGIILYIWCMGLIFIGIIGTVEYGPSWETIIGIVGISGVIYLSEKNQKKCN